MMSMFRVGEAEEAKNRHLDIFPVVPFQKGVFIARCLNRGSLCGSAPNCSTAQPPWTLRVCAGSSQPLPVGPLCPWVC